MFRDHFSDDARADELRSLDAFGHGTHLAGIVAAVAPGAQIVNVKVADSDGSTSLARLLAGIDWVARHGDRRGLDVRVLNLAFGWAWADPVAGLVIVVFAVREGLEAWRGDACAVPVSALTGERDVEACDCC